MADELMTLQTIVANLEAELLNETTRRLALTAAGNPPPTSYSVGGKMVDWNGYMSSMLARIKEAKALLNAEDLYEIHEHGYL
jgi:hypothetical protein